MSKKKIGFKNLGDKLVRDRQDPRTVNEQVIHQDSQYAGTSHKTLKMHKATPSRADKKALICYVTKDMGKKVRMLALEKDMTVQDLLVSAVQQWMDKNA